MRRRTFGKMTSALGLAAAAPWAREAHAAGPLEAASGEPVYFRGWQFATDVVQSNVQRYNDTQNGKIDYATVTGDYPAIMEQNLMAASELDVLYANPSTAVRYFEGGWVLPAEQLAEIEAIKADMLPQFREAWS